MATSSDSGRFFFALWPEPELAGQIQRTVATPLASCDGKKVPLENYHITLAFYGRAGTDKLACLQQVAGMVRGEPFVLSLTTLGYWPKPRVIWLAPIGLPEALIALQAELSRVLAAHCGYQAEKRPYFPHLTLTRKSHRGPQQQAIPPLRWSVSQFALVQSITHPEGAEYKVLKQWPLLD